MNRPKREVELLLEDLLPFAKRMLATHREFYPFGGYLKADGTIVHAGAVDPSTDRPKSALLIELLQRDFRTRAERKEIRASAILFRVGMPGTPVMGEHEAIQASVEHVAGYAAEVFFPYEFSTGGEPRFGVTRAQQGGRVIFAGLSE